MKFFNVILLPLLIISTTAKGQNWPACDSLVINCCTFDSIGPNTVTLQAFNFSSELFPYPNFALLDSNMDTVAMEQVTYFGIGSGPQPHTMTLLAPLTLPFNGYLLLFSWMQDTLPCVFPFTIPDTISGIPSIEVHKKLMVYPNPAESTPAISITAVSLFSGPATFSVWNVYGSCIRNVEIVLNQGECSPDIRFLNPGVYVIRIDAGGNSYSARFVKL